MYQLQKKHALNFADLTKEMITSKTMELNYDNLSPASLKYMEAT